MMGGALGLAVLASLAASRTDGLLASGYHAAFLVGAVFAGAAAVLGALFLRTRSLGERGDEPAGVPATAYEL